jgi:ParB-like chromosome segregation protein Spo0J
VTIPILSLQPGESPRLEGEDKAHIMQLAQSESPLPPILVDQRSMQVIDGMHRLMAALSKGRETIDVVFFDGSTADAFLRAVEANVTHGLPLSQADRRAAAMRIVASHPHMSDRAIAESAGMSANTVAGIRRGSTDAATQLNTRVGRDGKVRPLDGVAGRMRAAEFIAERPQASLRAIAQVAGVSPATARDVRRRLERGEEPVPGRSATAEGCDNPAGGGQAVGACQAGGADAWRLSRGMRAAMSATALVLDKLQRDPTLRHSEQGRQLLRWLQQNASGAHESSGAVTAVPPHCTALVVQLAHQYAQLWLDFANELNRRARAYPPDNQQRSSTN